MLPTINQLIADGALEARTGYTMHQSRKALADLVAEGAQS